ncbi:MULTISPECIES: RHS repeat-associated core domain-containing protein [unclassified Pseudomonas]|uniref:RHS repeat-associated core domain-containing protein n=1 Tax=unclassified Pseudomonas TaxID=196821 RepID=UPI0039B73EDF
MPPSSMKVLCRYHYDPLDRLTGLKPLESPGMQRFYQNNELVNEIDSEAQLTIVRSGEQPLAQRLSVIGVTETTLLATDQQRSPLTALTDADLQWMAYTAYGHRSGQSGLSRLLGFNGERRDPVTGHYLLGQGHRAFNPVLMRFNSPDELSPFGEGGINAYAYCGGDPVNRYDPSGNISFHVIQRLRSALPPPQQTPLDLSIPRAALSRPLDLTVPRYNTAPLSASTNTVNPSVAPRVRSVAASLEPEQLGRQPLHRNQNPTPAQRRQQNFYDRRVQGARMWDQFVRNNPDTIIDAKPKYLRRLESTKKNLDVFRKGGIVIGSKGQALTDSNLTSAVAKAKLAVKSDAFRTAKQELLRKIERANRTNRKIRIQ